MASGASAIRRVTLRYGNTAILDCLTQVNARAAPMGNVALQRNAVWAANAARSNSRRAAERQVPLRPGRGPGRGSAAQVLNTGELVLDSRKNQT